MRNTKTTQAVEAADTNWIISRFRLKVIDGPDKGTEHEAAAGQVTIGTHKSNSFALSDPTMSRFHSEIQFSDGKVIVRDVGSRNGTLLDGVAVQSAYLRG